MHVFRKLLMMIYLAAFSGCATSRDGATDGGATYEEPSFVVCLSRKWTPKERQQIDIDILEDSKGASIRLNSQSDHRIADMGRYLRLKKRILTSAQWNNRVSATSLPFVFTGPPRDILSVYMRGEGICLQGSNVPEAWKREIIRMADDVESKKTNK